jgi:MmyB-like transcription regulator ligand binding domain
VLEALARALSLNDTEREHLFAVARPARGGRAPLRPQRVRPGLYRVLDSLTGIPATVVGRRLDVLATNKMARALVTDFDPLPHRERNMVRYMFLNDGSRELYLDWEIAARSTVAALHRYAGRYPSDPQLAELVGDLSVRDNGLSAADGPTTTCSSMATGISGCNRRCACWPAGSATRRPPRAQTPPPQPAGLAG